MFSCKYSFFYKTGFHLSGKKSLDLNINIYNLIFYLGKRKNGFIVKFNNFLYNFRIGLFFLYRVISLRGKVLAFDERFYIRRCLIFFLNRANQHYLIKHWIGGTLTNFKNFQLFFSQLIKGFRSIKKYYDFFIYFFGLKRLQQIPSLLILTNPNDSLVSLQEGARLGLPILSLININTENMFGINFPIPSNNNDLKPLYFFYTIIGDALLYGWLRPVSFYFQKYFRRLKFFRKMHLIKTSYDYIFHNFKFLQTKDFIAKSKKFLKKFGLCFFKNNNFFIYLKKKSIFKLKVSIINTHLINLKTIEKKFFKNSFFSLWFLKRIFKLKRKRRRRFFKRLFKYRRRHRIKKRRFKVLRFFRFKVRVYLKKLFRVKKRFIRKNFYYRSFIKYNFYKELYKKKSFFNILKQTRYEEKHIEEILDEFDELPEERKQKMLKKLNEHFSILNVEFVEMDKNDKDFLKVSKSLFVKQFNFKIFKFRKLMNKIKVLKFTTPIILVSLKKKRLVDSFTKNKRNYSKLFNQRRKQLYNYKVKKNDLIFSPKNLNLLYLKAFE